MFGASPLDRRSVAVRAGGCVAATKLGLLIVAVAMLVNACGSSSPATRPRSTVSIDGVITYKGLSHDHVAAPVSYPQSPPVGGKHWPPRARGVLGWQACAVYTAPVVNEFAVHSLEHGAVWLTYRPDAAAGEIVKLSALAALRSPYVLVSPYSGQAKPFVATAWGLQLATDTVEDVRLATFTRAYAGGGQGGEPGADCAHGSNLEQARGARQAAK